MKVIDLTTLYIDGGEGGVNTYLKEKARFFSGAGGDLRHTVIVPGRRTTTGKLWKTTVHTLRSPRLPGNAHRVIVDFRRLGRLLRDEDPDVVEVDSSYLLGRVAARAFRGRGVPIVGFYHVHLPFLHVRPDRSRLLRGFRSRTEPLVWRYIEFCARPFDRVVVTTRDMHARIARRGLPPIEVVPHGVNLDLFVPRSNGSRPPLAGIDPGRPVLLYVGRLGAEKDLDVLFDAHRELGRDPGVQLVIAGDGPLRKRVERFARRTPHVAYLGLCPYGESLAELYRSADVLAVPGRNETFSLIILEAFASGLPVVAVEQGGPGETLKPGTGELARPGDPRDFAEKVRKVLRGPALGPACRRHVEKHYSWEKTFGRLLEIYESLRDEKAGTASRRRIPIGPPAKPLAWRA